MNDEEFEEALSALDEQYAALVSDEPDFAAYTNDSIMGAGPPKGEIDTFAVSVLSLTKARDGLAAGHHVLMALARKAAPGHEREGYLNRMRVDLLELSAVTKELVSDPGGVYAPIEAAFKAAAGELKSAHDKAVKDAANLGLAAGVIDAFGKLVAVL